MTDQPDASMIEDESIPGAEERFLINLNRNVSLRELARLMADGMDPDKAYDMVLAQSKVKKDE
jgi:hypothetical protein